jgi:hypothetical protein
MNPNGKHSTSDWRDYRLLVLDKLTELDKDLKDHTTQNSTSFKQIEQRLDKIELEIATQKAKMQIVGGLWGFVSGIAASIATGIVMLWVKKG